MTYDTKTNIKSLLATIYRDMQNVRSELSTLLLFKPGEENDLSDAYGLVGLEMDELEAIFEKIFPKNSLSRDWLSILDALKE